ncbi:glycoside hydrolase family 5 protein [Lacunimicrobium album]
MSKVLLTFLLFLSLASPTLADEFSEIGVNLAGGEFGKGLGVFNKDYTYPTSKQFDYCQSKGISIVRVPFKWERVQPKLMDPLNDDEVKRLQAVIDLGKQRGILVLLDMHNYARYNGKLIGTEDVPNTAYADVWQKLATAFKAEGDRLAYGIMNEPHGTKGLWPAAAQAAVDAIRSVDQTHFITVNGDGYSGAHSWRKLNETLLLNDPADKLIYEAHQYFDHNNSGTYTKTYDTDGVTPETGVKRLQPFFDWLKEHNKRGMIGEFGIPDNDPRWLVVMDNALAAMKKHNVGGTYWAAGGWWGKYPLSIEPKDGQDRPQMAVLDYYLSESPDSSKKPWLGAARLADTDAEKARQDDATLGKRIYDFRDKAESYHYKNEESTFTSELSTEGETRSRIIKIRHNGNPAYIGLGLYFGTLKLTGTTQFILEAKAETPCSLEVKIHTTTGKKYSHSYNITQDWQPLNIPFTDFQNNSDSLATTDQIQKIELQPSTTKTGNKIYLTTFRLK